MWVVQKILEYLTFSVVWCLLKNVSIHTKCTCTFVYCRSVARKETLGVHQKNWVCHIYCQINAQKKQACLLGINMLV